MKSKKTNEGLMKEVIWIIILFVAIAFLVNMLVSRRVYNNEPTIEDLHQQQEMIDYHRTQGRKLILN